MWDSVNLKAMNEAAELAAKHGGVKRKEALFNIGGHRVVESKLYADGHTLLTCEECHEQALSESELSAKHCTHRRRPAGW